MSITEDGLKARLRSVSVGDGEDAEAVATTAEAKVQVRGDLLDRIKPFFWPVVAIMGLSAVAEVLRAIGDTTHVLRGGKP